LGGNFNAKSPKSGEFDSICRLYFRLDKLVFWVYCISKSTKGTLASVQKSCNVRLYDATSGLFLALLYLVLFSLTSYLILAKINAHELSPKKVTARRDSNPLPSRPETRQGSATYIRVLDSYLKKYITNGEWSQWDIN